MADLAELLERLAPHSLRGGVRRAQLGVLFLERDQLTQQIVVLGIRDLRIVEDVVAVVVVLEDPPELGGARRGARFRRTGVLTPPADGVQRRPPPGPQQVGEVPRPDLLHAVDVRELEVQGRDGDPARPVIAAKSVPSSWW